MLESFAGKMYETADLAPAFLKGDSYLDVSK